MNYSIYPCNKQNKTEIKMRITIKKKGKGNQQHGNMCNYIFCHQHIDGHKYDDIRSEYI